MRIIGIATQPASSRQITMKDKTERIIWTIPILDEDLNSVVQVQSWGAENPWPKATRGTALELRVSRFSSDPKYGDQATLAPNRPTA